MVTRDTAWGDGTPCWVDLGVADIAKAGAFYAELFGWEVHHGPPEAGGEALCLDGGRLVAGDSPAGVARDSPFRPVPRPAAGVRLANEPGSLTWNESLSRDFDGNKAFYHAVFGYDYGDIGDTRFRYATLKAGGSEVGGIGELDSSLPAEVQAHWSVYFAVEDTDAAAATVSGLGGSTVRPAWDSPYGRIAVVADDHGAVFSLISPPADNA